MAHLLIVEDEPKIARLLQDYLQAGGHSATTIDHGDKVAPWLQQNHCDLMLLDIMLPGQDGITICRELRRHSQLPVIMLTARVEEVDRLLGLELGADDYICKPFSPKEVVARVAAVLRRSGGLPNQARRVVIDDQALLIYIDGNSLNLTLSEYRLLARMASNPGRVYSREQLIEGMHNDFRDITDRAVDSHIKNLRKKLAAALGDEPVIHSVYGAGYRFELAI